MVQRYRFIGVTVLSVLVLAIIASVSLSPAYAGPCISYSLSSSTITQGTASVTLTGVDNCNSGGTDTYQVYSGACPGVSPVAGATGSFVTSIVTPPPPYGSYGPVTITTSGLPAGTYCVVVTSGVDVSTPPTANAGLTVTATPIPEYPVGLAVLAIFMVLAYGVIRRKTITKLK